MGTNTKIMTLYQALAEKKILEKRVAKIQSLLQQLLIKSEQIACYCVIVFGTCVDIDR